MKLSLLPILLSLNIVTYAAPSTSPNTESLSLYERASSIFEPIHHDLEKRRGGGGGKGGGTSGGSGGGSTGGSGGRTSGGSSGGRPASSYSFSPSSNAGGRTISGSGQKPAYGGRYVGGASVPYTAGARSPTRGISPAVYPLAFFPGLWFFPVYAYPYGYGYHWYGNGRNNTSNVTCLCQQYSECGCDPQDNSTLLAQQITNGSTSGPPVNSTQVKTVDWGNGSVISYINGTLENGTTAPGGTDPSNEDEISAATRLMVNFSGYWLMIATVITGIVFM